MDEIGTERAKALFLQSCAEDAGTEFHYTPTPPSPSDGVRRTPTLSQEVELQLRAEDLLLQVRALEGSARDLALAAVYEDETRALAALSCPFGVPDCPI